VEPSQAGAAAAAPGQEVTQPFPNVQQRTSSQWHQQQQPLDWLQSEEQALQLLSRLAFLPQAVCRQLLPVHRRLLSPTQRQMERLADRLWVLACRIQQVLALLVTV
jgi:hypothetical protein